MAFKLCLFGLWSAPPNLFKELKNSIAMKQMLQSKNVQGSEQAISQRET